MRRQIFIQVFSSRKPHKPRSSFTCNLGPLLDCGILGSAVDESRRRNTHGVVCRSAEPFVEVRGRFGCTAEHVLGFPPQPLARKVRRRCERFGEWDVHRAVSAHKRVWKTWRSHKSHPHYISEEDEHFFFMHPKISLIHHCFDQ